jgi:putative transposase
MQVLRGFKYKLKLNICQTVTFNQWIGTNRCLYNIGLMQRTMNDYREHRIAYKEQAAELPSLKREFPWMKDPPSQTLQQTLLHLDKAFQRFFKGESSFPKPKRKHQESGITFPTPNSIRLIPTTNPKKGLVKLPKIGVLRFRKSREIEGELRSCTISKGSDGFYISFLCRVEMEKPVNRHGEIGIDRGVIHTLAFSSQVDGVCFKDLPVARIKRLEEKIQSLQRDLRTGRRLKRRLGIYIIGSLA